MTSLTLLEVYDCLQCLWAALKPRERIPKALILKIYCFPSLFYKLFLFLWYCQSLLLQGIHKDIHSSCTFRCSALRQFFMPTMASADFSQFVVTTANVTACETSWDKFRTFRRLPAWYLCIKVTVSLLLLLACVSQRKPCKSLLGSLATTPLGTFTQSSGYTRHNKKSRITPCVFLLPLPWLCNILLQLHIA